MACRDDMRILWTNLLPPSLQKQNGLKSSTIHSVLLPSLQPGFCCFCPAWEAVKSSLSYAKLTSLTEVVTKAHSWLAPSPPGPLPPRARVYEGVDAWFFSSASQTWIAEFAVAAAAPVLVAISEPLPYHRRRRRCAHRSHSTLCCRPSAVLTAKMCPKANKLFARFDDGCKLPKPKPTGPKEERRLYLHLSANPKNTN